MERILKFFNFKSKRTSDLKQVAEKQLSKNIEVIKSLRDYDEGKKDISTNNVQKHLPHVQVTTH